MDDGWEVSGEGESRLGGWSDRHCRRQDAEPFFVRFLRALHPGSRHHAGVLCCGIVIVVVI